MNTRVLILIFIAVFSSCPDIVKFDPPDYADSRIGPVNGAGSSINLQQGLLAGPDRYPHSSDYESMDSRLSWGYDDRQFNTTPSVSDFYDTE